MQKIKVPSHDGIPLDPDIRLFVPESKGAFLVNEAGFLVPVSGWAFLHGECDWAVPVVRSTEMCFAYDPVDELVPWSCYEEDFVGGPDGDPVIVMTQAWSDHEDQQKARLDALAVGRS